MTLRRRTAAVASLVATAALLAVLGGSAGARAGFTVKLGDDFFAPNEATVAAGTKVRFKWVGEDEHNIAKKRGPGGSFSSPLTDQQGVQFTKKLKKRGTYRLICTVHDEMKMKLKVD